MRKRICGVTIFICVILYVLFGYYGPRFNIDHSWAWGLFVFLLVPLMPIILGLRKPYISYTLLVIIAYLVIGFVFHGWHPWWVIFLTIPVYYGIFGERFKHIRITKDNDSKQKKDNDDDDIEIL